MTAQREHVMIECRAKYGTYVSMCHPFRGSEDVVKEEAEYKNLMKWCLVSTADIRLLQSIVLELIAASICDYLYKIGTRLGLTMSHALLWTGRLFGGPTPS